MTWIDARKRLREHESGRPVPGGRDATARPRHPWGGLRRSPRQQADGRLHAASVCVASGKGGTGKSVVSASLAHEFTRLGRTLVVDADLGVGNAHILQNVTPTRSLVDVVEGEARVRDVVVDCGEGVDLLAAGSGVPRMAELSSYELVLIATGLADVEQDYATLVVDSAAGLARQTLAFARACDEVVLVTTPDLTAMTDAYAFLKVLTGRAPGSEPLLVVNRARSVEEAEEVASRITRVARRFLGRGPRRLGWIPEDPTVQDCVNRRGAVTALEPQCQAGVALGELAQHLRGLLAERGSGGMGRALLSALE